MKLDKFPIGKAVIPFAIAIAFGIAMLTPSIVSSQASPYNKQRNSGYGGGGGGGIGISIDIGTIIDQARRTSRPPRPPHRPRITTKKKCKYGGRGGKCRKKPRVTVVIDIPRVQNCLVRAGFDPGPVDGKAGGKTRNAFRAFQEANGLEKRPRSVYDKPSRDLLFDLCKQPPPPPEVVASVTPSPGTASNCLPQDLYGRLTRAYGQRSGVQSCPNACLPKPAGYGQVELDRLAASNDITWCTNCVRLGAYLPLAAILKIESSASIQLCASPPAQACYLPSPAIIKTYPKVRTIFRHLPISIGNEGDLAVLIGNEDYGDAIPANHNAQRDAAALHTLLTEQLGYSENNIIDLRNAKLADFHRVFGSPSNPVGELAKRLQQRRRSDVFIYISSHGMTLEEEGKSFVLPSDVQLDALDRTAVPLQQFYETLGKLGAGTIMLILEANFGRSVEELIDPPNLPQMSMNVMPAIPVPGLAVYKASDRDQLTLEDPEYGIGLFTRYLIEGLAGKADEAPIGNGDQRIDTVELFVYTSNMVRTAARKSFGLEQKPMLSEIDNIVVGRLAGR